MKPKKLIIVGGVAGGATAAARARRLDEFAEIVMFERGDFRFGIYMPLRGRAKCTPLPAIFCCWWFLFPGKFPLPGLGVFCVVRAIG